MFEGSEGKTILVVDDDEINQLIVVEELKLRGYRVDVAANGLEAFERVKRDSCFIAVLMDCQMPVMDGYTAAQEIRKWEASYGDGRHIPIIALTAHDLVGERDRVIKAGMDDCLSKPFRPSALERLLPIYIKEGSSRVLEVVKVQEASPPQEEDLALDIKRSEKLTRLFLDKAPEQVRLLGQAILDGKAADVRTTAHKLKGSCLAIGAGPMSKLAEMLQMKADAGDISEAPEAFIKLKAHHAKVEHLLRAELESGGGAG